MKKVIASLLVVNTLGALTVAWMILERFREPVCDEVTGEGCVADIDLSTVDVRVRYGAEKPTYRVYTFVDFSSDSARQTYQALTSALTDSALSREVELLVLHAPGDSCTAGDSSYACTAAAVVECAASIAPGVGAAVAGDAFDAQWQRTRDPSAVLIESAQHHVNEALNGRAPSVASCLKSVRAVPERIALHASIAAKIGVRGIGGLVVRVDEPERRVPFSDWLSAETLPRVIDCLRGDGCEEFGS